MLPSVKALGGYIELELPFYGNNISDQAFKYSSARGALVSLVDQLEKKEIWLPHYICSSVIEAFSGRNISLKFYTLKDDFTVKENITFNEESLFLYVNYFGLCSKKVKDIILEYGSDRVVIDNSQALFSEIPETLATIYSPRKFFGLPDGGLLYSRSPKVKRPEDRDATSEGRMSHLISRLVNRPESTFEQFKNADREIGDLPIQGMSRLTERLLNSVNYESARVSRARNARYLHMHLGEYNQLNLKFDDNTAPLCYPFLPSVKTASRSELISQRVFVPSYWPEVLSRVEEGSFEWDLVTNGLFLPCDQRYNEDDMDRLISLLAIK